jgi:hypothetical protein
MRYCFSLGILLAAFGFFSTDCQAVEVESDAGKNIVRTVVSSSPWNSQLTINYLPSADLHGGPGDAGLTDYRIRVARNLKYNDQLTLTLGGGYGLKHIDASLPADLPQDLHSLFLEAGASYRINDKAFASLRLSPGFYSDFKDLGEDDLRMPVLLLGGYSFANGISVVGGFVYRFGYHASQYIPALGISYLPNDSWRIDLVAPRPAVTYFASRQLQLFVGGDFSSDEYELKDHSSGSKVIKYSDLKAMAGFNYLPVPDVKLSTSVGYAFERRFMFFDGNRPDMRLDDIPFFKLSLDIGW